MQPMQPRQPTNPSPADRVEPQFRDAYHAHRQAPSPQTAGAFLDAVTPVLSMGARTYGGGHSPLVMSRARRLALDALDQYDPAKASLRTHLMSHLQGLRRYSASVGKTVAVPEQVLLDRRRVRESTASLADELGRDPSDSELADHSGLSMKRLGYVRAYKPPVSEGQLIQQSLERDDESGTPAVAVRGLDPSHARAEFLYHDLDPTDQVILERSLGLRGLTPASHKEIAAGLGISPPAVTQRARRLQERLDELENTEIF